MPSSTLLLTLLFTSTLALGASQFHSRQEASTSNSSSSPVAITTLSQTHNATGGTGQVAAAGSLSSFGDIGVGCGINWEEDVSFGGGLQAGSPSFGLGGGYTITPHTMTIGAGIGYNNERNASASLQFEGKDDGSFALEFEATGEFACVPGRTQDGKWSVRCTSGSAPGV